MYTLACRDLGMECDFVAEGATKEEAMENSKAHAMVAHADMMEGKTDEEMAAMTAKMEAAVMGSDEAAEAAEGEMEEKEEAAS